MKRDCPIQPPTKPETARRFAPGLAAALILGLAACGPPPPKNVTRGTAPSPAASPAPRETVLDTAHFIGELTNLRRLMVHNPGESMVMRSSSAPKNGGDDAGHYLDTFEDAAGTWNVILDEKGPGCVTRIMIGGQTEGRIRFYFDRDATPVIDEDLQTFFSGEYRYFRLLQVFKPEISGNAYVSYFPFPFELHCRIAIQTGSGPAAYQVNALKLPAGTPVESYRIDIGEEGLAALEEANQFVQDTALGHYQNTVFDKPDSVTLQPGKQRLMLNLPGPGAIDFLALRLDPLDVESISKIRMKIYWDDLPVPAVDSSVREFFCSNVEVKGMWNSLPMGFYADENQIPEGIFYCQYPMPFQNQAQVILENASDKPVDAILQHHLDRTPLPDDWLYFMAQSSQRRLHLGLIYPTMEFIGKGKFAGLNMHARVFEDSEPKNFILGGDESIYVNGEPSPSWPGTGMDNYFNGDGGMQNHAPFWTPLHGCLQVTNEGGGVFHGYRFHMLDAIPFDTSFFAIQEIGCPALYENVQHESMVPVLCEWTNYWYGKPTAADVPRNEQVHFYAIDQTETNVPTAENPVMKDLNLRLKVPVGEWWLHFAPVWDLSQVNHQRYVVE